MRDPKTLMHAWSVVCTNSLLDKESNNISLLNTLEKLTFTVLKADWDRVKKDEAENIIFPISFEIVSRFSRHQTGGAEAFDYRISIVNPVGKTVVNSDQKIAIDKHIKNIRVRTNIQSLPVISSGDYVVVVQFKNVGESRFVKMAELPIEVVVDIVSDDINAVKK